MQDLILGNPTPNFVMLSDQPNVPLTLSLGNRDNLIIFDADPSDGTINISTDSADITFDVEDFALVAELLIRAAEGV